MGILSGTREYFTNAKILSLRGKLGFTEAVCCVNYYSGVVHKIECAQCDFEHFYLYLTYSTYDDVIATIMKDTGKSRRTAFRILCSESLKCIHLIEEYEKAHYEEFIKEYSKYL